VHTQNFIQIVWVGAKIVYKRSGTGRSKIHVN